MDGDQSKILSQLAKVQSQFGKFISAQGGMVSATPVSYDADAPALPLSSTLTENGIRFSDIIRTLHFSDRVQKGDWANSFQIVRDHGRYLDLVRVPEQLLEIFEQEGVFVEDLVQNDTGPDLWRLFAKGHRGENMKDLITIHDKSSEVIIANRLRNDPEAKELSLNFQKQIIELLARFIKLATDDDYTHFSSCRSGRAFIIVGKISKIFG